MTITATPHVNFRGDARAALEFYRSVFDGELTLVSYADAHSVTDAAEAAEAAQIMFGEVSTESGFRIMAFDVPSSREWQPGIIPFYVVLRIGDAEETTERWQRLIEGGTVLVELASSAWSPLYGMARDRFGVTWVVSLETA